MLINIKIKILKQIFYTTGEEDTYGEGTGSVYEGDCGFNTDILSIG